MRTARHWIAASVLPTLILGWFRCVSWGRLVLLQRHSGVGRFLGYGLGLLLSFRFGLVRGWRIYFPKGRAALSTGEPGSGAAATAWGRAACLSGMALPDSLGQPLVAGWKSIDLGPPYDLAAGAGPAVPLLGPVLAVLASVLAFITARRQRSGCGPIMGTGRVQVDG